MRISLDEAVRKLLNEDVVAIPTETVYGLAASLYAPSAIQKIFSLKKRPQNNPLIIHIGELEQAREFSHSWSPLAQELASLWPAPLSLLVPARQEVVPSLVRSGLPTVAIRMPAHPLCRELLQKTGPLVAPSANLSGRPSATEARHVEQDFGLEFPVLDGGPCMKGLESTIVWTESPGRIARLGSLTKEEIEQRLGIPLLLGAEETSHQEHPICPGQLLRHYAPKAKIYRLSQEIPLKDLPLIGFTDRIYHKIPRWFLGNSRNPSACAECLYRVLRALDEENIQEVLLDDRFGQGGLWETIRERCDKAARSSGSLPSYEYVCAMQ